MVAVYIEHQWLNIVLFLTMHIFGKEFHLKMNPGAHTSQLSIFLL